MKPIGGYFELELNHFPEYHQYAIKLNTARSALEYALRVNVYRKIYIPYYTCDVMLEPVKNAGIDFEFYHIGKGFMPMLDSIETDAVLLFTNYFGICDRLVERVVDRFGDVIVDNSQAFYTLPINAISTFYSCKKFFGVPDGSYLYCTKSINQEIETDLSKDRMDHLIKRIELSAEAGFADFQANDISFTGQPIKRMSKLTQALMKNIEYDQVKKQRLENFDYLHRALQDRNEISIDRNAINCPMAYPFLIDKKGIRHELINRKIFVAQYWPNVLEWVEQDCHEYYLATRLLPLPIDQRLDGFDLDRIISDLHDILKQT
jgi:hypothetical protein